jgi:hypothetical protein
MKTKNLFRLLAAMMLITVSFISFGFKPAPPLKKANPIVKVKKVTSKKMVTYYFDFYDGNEFVVQGRGGAGPNTTGTIFSYVAGCMFPGSTQQQFVGSGTATGTFTISGGVCTIDINITPSGFPLEGWSGSAEYSNTILKTACQQ